MTFKFENGIKGLPCNSSIQLYGTDSSLTSITPWHKIIHTIILWNRTRLADRSFSCKNNVINVFESPIPEGKKRNRTRRIIKQRRALTSVPAITRQTKSAMPVQGQYTPKHGADSVDSQAALVDLPLVYLLWGTYKKNTFMFLRLCE